MTTTTIDRAAHLETTIQDAERELHSLRAEEARQKQMAALGNELKRFRQLVADARRLLDKFGTDIDATIEAMKSEAEGSVVVDFRGVVSNEPARVGKLTQLTEKLRTDLLGRARHARQLRDLEDRLEGLERQNQQRPAAWQV